MFDGDVMFGSVVFVPLAVLSLRIAVPDDEAGK